MENGTLFFAAALILAAAIMAGAMLVFAALRRGARAPGNEREHELGGRLDQMAGAQSAALVQMSERLQAQERLLGKMLEERLETVTKRVNETLEKSALQQTATFGELRERLVRIDAAQANITELSSQMVSLQNILSNKQARGAYGEVQLRDLVSSVLPPQAYKFQAPLGDGKRVDCLLTLPNPPGPIAIDAKFPLESYHLLRAATDDAQRQLAGRAFRLDMTKHINDIAGKYIVAGETAESALMFLPSEAVYAELHANFGDVVEQSYRARVFIVSPTTLWATLNTIRAVLKDVRMREQAGIIQTEVRGLLVDIRRLDERVGKLKSHFEQATDDFRQIGISTEKVTRRAEKIDQLQLEDPAPADALDRPANATQPDESTLL
jgi:DNA recombination protein RmuC